MNSKVTSNVVIIVFSKLAPWNNLGLVKAFMVHMVIIKTNPYSYAQSHS